MPAFSIPYPPHEDQSASVPDAIAVREVTPGRIPSKIDPVVMVRDGLAHPIACPPIQALITRMSRKGGEVLLLVDDHTRVTPVQTILPPLLEELHRCGIERSQVTFLVAGGSHRPMSQLEMEAKFGKNLLHDYTFLPHEFDNPAALTSYGKTSRGIEVKVNARAARAAFKIGTGNIIPHEIAGFSGGYKAIIPGISTQETVGQVHWLSTQVSLFARLGAIANPVRDQINEGGARVGLDFIVNTVLDAQGEVAGIFCGNPIQAHAEGCALSRRIFAVVAPPTDIVVAEAVPEYTDWWTCSKAALHGAGFVKKGGVLIVAAACTEGLCATHPQILEMRYQPPTDLEANFLQVAPRKYNRLTATHCANLWEVLQHCSLFVVTRGIPASDAARLGLRRFTSLQEAIDCALIAKPKAKKINVLRHGVEIMQATYHI